MPASAPAGTRISDRGRSSGSSEPASPVARPDLIHAGIPLITPTPPERLRIQSGTFPIEVVPITSLVGQFLREQGAGDVAEDLEAFEKTLLHYRRTFVEKLFALHGKVARVVQEDVPLGRDARHYSDLHALAEQHEVRAMLASPEYTSIREDYDTTSRKFFPKSYRPPAELSFRDSPALFPEPALRDRLADDYEQQCRLLFFAGYPRFDDVLARFAEIRHLL